MTNIRFPRHLFSSSLEQTFGRALMKRGSQNVFLKMYYSKSISQNIFLLNKHLKEHSWNEVQRSSLEFARSASHCLCKLLPSGAICLFPPNVFISQNAFPTTWFSFNFSEIPKLKCHILITGLNPLKCNIFKSSIHFFRMKSRITSKMRDNHVKSVKERIGMMADI